MSMLQMFNARSTLGQWLRAGLAAVAVCVVAIGRWSPTSTEKTVIRMVEGEKIVEISSDGVIIRAGSNVAELRASGLIVRRQVTAADGVTTTYTTFIGAAMFDAVSEDGVDTYALRMMPNFLSIAAESTAGSHGTAQLGTDGLYFDLVNGVGTSRGLELSVKQNPAIDMHRPDGTSRRIE
ncbi:MAG: hypothetical protein IPM29_17330 [Planctomycetes bacterium]|nr:hypothetical protein [Planctomycetota bacterium]